MDPQSDTPVAVRQIVSEFERDTEIAYGIYKASADSPDDRFSYLDRRVHSLTKAILGLMPHAVAGEDVLRLSREQQRSEAA